MNFFVILFREIAVRLLRKHYKIIWNNLTITISAATKWLHSTTKNMHLNRDEIDQLNYKQCNQDFLQQQLILSLRNQASKGSARITGMTMLNVSDAALHPIGLVALFEHSGILINFCTNVTVIMG